MPPERPKYICFEILITFWFVSLIDNYKAKPIWRHILTKQLDWMKLRLSMGFFGLWSLLCFGLSFFGLLIIFNEVCHKYFRWPNLDLLGPTRQHIGLSKLGSRFRFGTKATSTHKALNVHSFQVGTKAWMSQAGLWWKLCMFIT